MNKNRLRIAIQSSTALAVFAMAGQAVAIDLDPADYDATLYGFARVAASYDLDENISSGGQSGSLGAINTSGTDGAQGHFGMDANTSRLGVSVMSPEGVKTVVEFDFDNNNSLVPRLRLAYGEYKGVMIGQNWSNFLSFLGNSSTLDFDSLPGTGGTVNRVPQIRYTTGPLSFSIEETLGNLVNNDLGGPSSTSQSTPAFTARLQDSAGGLSYATAVMAKQITVDDGTTDDSAMGYGAFVSGRLAVTDMLTLKAAINYTDGAAAYIYRNGSNGFFGLDAYTKDASGDLETVETVGGTLGVAMNLGGGRSVNLGYGVAQQDLDDAADAGAGVGGDSEMNSMLAANYQWSPVANVKMGVEVAHLERENQDGSDGEANRVMFLAQYNF
ncbi:DcaP family trimeric outer membrane transporter [Marinobacter confluentis]|uniref:Porin n=1 Tax=Marinobacter confluentis TaxID=1697557 RepID=A0A4Z1BAC9_9GAMM|nr:DcaP family trimeric outer membrane transporter [Marinobacter confluentis]TGN38746.1 hypothetical protein E5Q11_13475 [Marinobacter confluentis]